LSVICALDDADRLGQLRFDLRVPADLGEGGVGDLERVGGGVGFELAQLVQQVVEGRLDVAAAMGVQGEAQGVPQPHGVHARHVLVEVDRVEAREEVGLLLGDQRPADRHPAAAGRDDLPGQDVDGPAGREPVGQHGG
jgi:hypothetical protein